MDDIKAPTRARPDPQAATVLEGPRWPSRLARDRPGRGAALAPGHAPGPDLAGRAGSTPGSPRARSSWRGWASPGPARSSFRAWPCATRRGSSSWPRAGSCSTGASSACWPRGRITGRSRSRGRPRRRATGRRVDRRPRRPRLGPEVGPAAPGGGRRPRRRAGPGGLDDGRLGRHQGRHAADRQPRAGRADRGGLARRRRSTIAPGRPIELAATLGDEGRSLEIRSTIDREPPGDRAVTVVGKGWPIHVRRAGSRPEGRFDGTLEASQEGRALDAQGRRRARGLRGDGPALRGDRLALDRVAAACDAGQSPAGWAIRKFDLTSPVATLRAGGAVPATDGHADAAPGPGRPRRPGEDAPPRHEAPRRPDPRPGTANLRLDLTTAGAVERVELAASLDDFAAVEGGPDGRAPRAGPRSPAWRPDGRARSRSRRLEVKAAGVDVTAGGDLEAGRQALGDGRPRRPDGAAPRRPRPRGLRPLGPRPGRRRLPARRRLASRGGSPPSART